MITSVQQVIASDMQTIGPDVRMIAFSVRHIAFVGLTCAFSKESFVESRANKTQHGLLGRGALVGLVVETQADAVLTDLDRLGAMLTRLGGFSA